MRGTLEYPLRIRNNTAILFYFVLDAPTPSKSKDRIYGNELIETNGKLVCELAMMRSRLETKDEKLLENYEKRYIEHLKMSKMQRQLESQEREILQLKSEIQNMKDAAFTGNLIDFEN